MTHEEFLTTDLREKFGKTQDEVLDAFAEKSHSGEWDSEYEALQSMRDCYIIQDILRRHPNAVGRPLEESCQRCGAHEVYCGHIDLGHADYDDHFWHLCLQCLDARHAERFEESGYESVEDTVCPFCRRV